MKYISTLQILILLNQLIHINSTTFESIQRRRLERNQTLQVLFREAPHHLTTICTFPSIFLECVRVRFKVLFRMTISPITFAISAHVVPRRGYFPTKTQK
jgi:hypothetical protein